MVLDMNMILLSKSLAFLIIIVSYTKKLYLNRRGQHQPRLVQLENDLVLRCITLITILINRAFTAVIRETKKHTHSSFSEWLP